MGTISESSTGDCPFCNFYVIGQAPDSFELHPPYAVGSFTPLNPVVPGHRLFIPIFHEEEYIGTAYQEADDYGRSRYEDYNVIRNVGKWASQTVAHPHVHLIPRHEGDGLQLPWTDR